MQTVARDLNNLFRSINILLENESGQWIKEKTVQYVYSVSKDQIIQPPTNFLKPSDNYVPPDLVFMIYAFCSQSVWFSCDSENTHWLFLWTSLLTLIFIMEVLCLLCSPGWNFKYYLSELPFQNFNSSTFVMWSYRLQIFTPILIFKIWILIIILQSH